MAMNLWDYFQWRCSVILTMERDIWQMNNLMMREARTPQLKEAFERHSGPTRQQISHLEQIVDGLGGVIGPEENPLTQGILRAHHQFMGVNPNQELIDLNHALEGEKIEQLEIAAYQELIAIAQELGANDVAQLLRQNLSGEENMSTLLTSLLPDLLTQANQRGMKKAA